MFPKSRIYIAKHQEIIRTAEHFLEFSNFNFKGTLSQDREAINLIFQLCNFGKDQASYRNKIELILFYHNSQAA